MEDSRNKNDVEILRHKMGKCLLSNMKATDYFLGFSAYAFTFAIDEYKGETFFSEKISPIEKAIVGILLIDESASIERIGNILGFNVVQDKAEYNILSNSIESLRRHEVLEGDDSSYSLTNEGRLFAAEGKRQEKVSYEFELWHSKEFPSFASFKDEISADEIIEIEDDSYESLDISIIQRIAQIQAPKVHNPSDERLLKSVDLIKSTAYNYMLYACFFKNVLTSEVRVLVYDESQDCILDDFSELINNNDSLKARLFDEIEESTFIPEEEIAKEPSAVDAIDEGSIEIEISDGDKVQKLHKKALYDEISFENELNQIFSDDHPDEVWLISPWIGYFFVECRVPMIEQVLKNGTKVFIAYSKKDPRDKKHTEMVHPLAQNEIERLSQTYPSFFCIELPKIFHTKNVLEVKGNQVIMFSGSFNILSFAIQESHKVIRGEQMAFVNPQKAKTEYRSYIDTFASIYVTKFKSKLQSEEAFSLSELQNNRFNYFLNKSSLANEVEDILDTIEDKITEIQKEEWSASIGKLQKMVSPILAHGIITHKDKKYIREQLSNLAESAKVLDLDDELLEMLSSLQEHIERLKVRKIAKSIVDENGKGVSDEGNEDYTQAIELMCAQKGSKRISPENLKTARTILKNGKLTNEHQVIRYMVSLNLMAQAIKNKTETKYGFYNLNNNVLKLIERAENNFPHLSLFIEGNITYIDLYGIQISFMYIPHTERTKSIISSRQNLVTEDKRQNMHFYANELFNLVFNRD